MNCERFEILEILLDSVTRQEHISHSLRLRGLSNVCEDKNKAYCPMSLTAIPDNVRNVMLFRQDIIRNILSDVSITTHEASKILLSPDKSPNATPQEVYRYDLSKLASARFFVAQMLLPSTGIGVELEIARDLNRFGIVLIDRNIKGTRMLPSGLIYLTFSNLKEEASAIKDVFSYLKTFEPGMGMSDQIVLLGFSGEGEVVNLNRKIEEMFPTLAFRYSGSKPKLNFKVENPDLIQH